MFYHPQSAPDKAPSLSLTSSQWWTVIAAVLLSRGVFYGFGLLGAHLFNPEVVADLPIWQQICRFDCVWFHRLAETGYDVAPSYMSGGNAANWAFMPVTPYLGKLISYAVGDIRLGLIIVSNLAFIASVVVLLMALKQLKFSDGLQNSAIWLICFSPYTVYSLSGYSEPLYIALVAGFFIACYRGNWWAVALMGLLAAVTRNLGVMLVFSALIFGVQYYGLASFIRLRTEAVRVITAIWLIPLGFFLLMTYLYFHVGDALAFGHIQVAWGRTFTHPLNWLQYGFERGGAKLYLAIVSLLGLALNIYLFTKKKFAEGVFMLISLWLPLSSGVNAMPRYIMGLYPTYLGIFMLLERFPKARMPVTLLGAVAGCFITIGFFSKMFFTV
ncbi:mannosyltransferase family protein [Vibrio hippocampi]|uniref:Glycosyltransferase RgtA/B/C/D-like domain-containing protein n=1 Tax=Vibrio hippocampi TaxID=654686 RepID=A0ABM8ZG80_9VIBR|nr:mannosyltransferase family protein [Vibrio hippocampi]CAH0525618.1 hypothetical protein VHP8226_01146 [Vibrio hippocampi]